MSNPGAPDQKPKEEISIEDIDKILAEDDPTFGQQMADIAMDQDLKTAEVQGQAVEVAGLLGDEEDAVSGAELEKGFAAKIRRLKQKFFAAIREAITRVKNRIVGGVRGLIYFGFHFIRHTIPDLIKFLLKQVKAVFGYLGSWVSAFFELPFWQKIVVLFIGALCAALGYLVKLNVKGQWLPGIGATFIASMEDVADEEIEINPDSKFVDFYLAFPQPQYSLLLPKVVANLKTSSEDSRNPMVAFQIFITTESETTAVEIKSREKEMIDIIARTTEDFAVNELLDEPGKERLKREIRKSINEKLSQGRVLSTYFKMFILKEQ